MPSVCYDSFGRASACAASTSIEQWFVGLLLVVGLTAAAFVALGFALHAFYGASLRDGTTRFLVVTGVVVVLLLCIAYTYRNGPAHIGRQM